MSGLGGSGLSFEWNKVTIGEVVESVIDNRGKTPPLTESGYELIEINAIVGKNRYPNYEKVSKFVSEDTYRTWFRKGHPQKDDLLISTVGSIGEVCLMERDRGCIAQNVIALRFHKKIANSMFFYYFFSWEETKTRLKTLDIGSVQPSLKVPHLLSTNLLMPPIEEQANIAAILSSLDDKLELNNAINKNLEEMAQALFKRWFVDFEFPNENGEPYKSSGGEFEESELGLIPKGWRVRPLGEIVEFRNGYAFKSQELMDEAVGDCYHVFKMGNIKKGGGLNRSGTKSFIAKDKCNSLGKFLIRKGDLLMCMTDMKSNVALLGHTALMDENEKYILNQRVGLLRVNDSQIINYPYLYLLTNTSDFIRSLRSRANSGVQVNLSTKEIKDSLVLVPNRIIHKLFDNVASEIFEKLFVINQETEILINIRDTLLPKLMSGEIRVPVERDHSAQELPMVAESSAIYQP